MKKIIYFLSFLISIISFTSCENESFIDDIYVEPKAEFSISEKEFFDVFESVVFTNKGEGQYFAVWTGDTDHKYGKTGDNGFACNSDGTFSYSYQEPGQYTAVWIASSIKSNGEVVSKVDSTTIKVRALSGGLSSFSITRMARISDFGSSFFYESYGQFVTENRIICPMPYSIWPNYVRRTLGIKYVLDSDFAKLQWESNDGDVDLVSEATNKVFRFDSDNKLQPQTLKVVTSSGAIDKYEVVAVVIPEFTSFKINGVEAKKSRDLSAFNKFNLEITLPAGTDLTSLSPEFVILNNDANLLYDNNRVIALVDGVAQESGVSKVDFSSEVAYTLKYSVVGSDNYEYVQECYFNVVIK